MHKDGPLYPFDPQRCIGTVAELAPSFAKINLPRAALPEGQWHYGNKLGAGEVGEFVVVDCGDIGIIGRIISVKLPEKERLAVEVELGREREAHPIGNVQLLTSLNIATQAVAGGLQRYPRLGSKVYSAHPSLLRQIAEATAGTDAKPARLHLGSVSTSLDHPIEFTPEAMFGRHCAVLGATGGGKSWTLARLVEQSARFRSKSILIDATGEFHTLVDGVRHCHLSHPTDGVSEEVVIPYRQLRESDILALFRPSGQSQAPKLRMAMKSLKIAKLVPALATNGIIKKALQLKRAYDDAWLTHAGIVEGPLADFDIFKLCAQIVEECVWPTGNEPSKWGNPNENEKGYCVTLLTRIEDLTHSGEMSCIFKSDGKRSLFDTIDAFLASPIERVLRISMKHVPFAYNVREIVANAIGRRLLDTARTGACAHQPLVVFLDEAHQFLDRSIGDENARYLLDAFDLIAKEGRKYCLNVCLATQRPRDVPEGVLSQMGTMLVHRLINDKDREIVERASGEIDRSAAAFLPTLSPGQAVIIGVDFPMPLTIQLQPPQRKPDSKGADFQTCWTSGAAVSAT